MKSAIAISLVLGTAIPSFAAEPPTADYYCYMVEGDGRLVDLEPLCFEPEEPEEPVESFGQGDLPISCNFQPDSEGVDQSEEALSLAIPFTCEAEEDIAASNMTLRLVLDGEASGSPLSQSMPALAEGETYDSVATFTVADPPENPNSVIVEYVIQEGLDEATPAVQEEGEPEGR
ncbi:MAG: hypothetical protein ACFBSF_02970 [Leptolyngbyaceae cyanobacterium]